MVEKFPETLESGNVLEKYMKCIDHIEKEAGNPRGDLVKLKKYLDELENLNQNFPSESIAEKLKKKGKIDLDEFPEVDHAIKKLNVLHGSKKSKIGSENIAAAVAATLASHLKVISQATDNLMGLKKRLEENNKRVRPVEDKNTSLGNFSS